MPKATINGKAPGRPSFSEDIQKMADFFGMDLVAQDGGRHEAYTFTNAQGEKLTLVANGDRFDGGFLTLKYDGRKAAGKKCTKCGK
jgi:hypothetical protein